MASVTYRNQPAIQATHGNVPLAGTSHLYRVTKVLWPPSVETYLKTLLIGRTLHVCCGLSRLGDVRLDLDRARREVQAVGRVVVLGGAVEFHSFCHFSSESGRKRWRLRKLSHSALWS